MTSTRNMLSAGLAAAVLLALSTSCGCRSESAPQPPPPVPLGSLRLTDVSDAVGLAYVHTDGSSGKRYIVEPMSAGLALFDYDGDGLIDIYFLNGAPMKGTVVSRAPTNALYRNEGQWRFRDVTDQAGVGDTGFGLGVTIGDFDNDGYPDLYLNNYGPNSLYRNNGDGTFQDVTSQAGVGNGSLVGAGACFLDIDSDSDLDLYVGNYLDFDYANHVARMIDGRPRYPVPRDFDPVPDSLFRNDGDGTFTDISAEAGISGQAGTSMGMVAVDGDHDGDTDVFVLNDVSENFFFENDGSGRFEEVAIFNGTAYNGYGDENASMGVDCGDYDNDGWPDFVMTSYQAELPVLYHNLGSGSFEDATTISGAGDGTFSHVNWGVGLVDFDNDGDRDIFIANGHTEDNIDGHDGSVVYRARNIVLSNQGTGQFVNVSAECGTGTHSIHSSRGTAFDDLDNDGDVDIVVLNSREPSTLIRNDADGTRHWIELRLVGIQANRDAVGSRVTVEAGGTSQTAHVHSGRGYQSHYGSRLHFGLGTIDRVDEIKIRWMGGEQQSLRDVAVDRTLTILQGQGQIIREGDR